VIATSVPECIFDADFKNVMICFVAHLIFEISVCFGYQLPSLQQAYDSMNNRSIVLHCDVPQDNNGCSRHTICESKTVHQP